MSDPKINEYEIGWYVSDVHCRRAIGYMSAKLVEDGDLAPNFQSPALLELWGEALQQTMDMDEPSPLGPDQETVRKFLLSTIEQRLTRIEERGDRIEEAIMKITHWLHVNVTHFGHRVEQEIEKILYGTKIT
jgi:hypothetical protein